jgi:hypothetical protein
MNKVVFAIGRFQPPTIGHETLISTVVKSARALNAQVRVFTTRTQDSAKNPLDIKQKLTFLKLAFPGIPFAEAFNAYEAAKDFNGFDEVIMIAGSDRAPQYQKMIARGFELNELTFGDFSVKTIERDPDSDNDISAASATLAREFAREDRLEDFLKIAPSRLNIEQKIELFNLVKLGLE